MFEKRWLQLNFLTFACVSSTGKRKLFKKKRNDMAINIYFCINFLLVQKKRGESKITYQDQTMIVSKVQEGFKI